VTDWNQANFCVDEIGVDGTIRQRVWFNTRVAAIRCADMRLLGAPVDPKSRLRVYALAPIHEVV